MRFGVVGTNFVSDAFMEGANQLEEVQVTAVCSGKRENAEKFAARYGIGHVYDDYISMLESGEIDAIYLATPNRMHHDMALVCLKHHIPTFCEKPLGGNLREVKEMLECAQYHQTYLHDGVVPMYSPNVKVLKEYLNRIGKIRRAVITMGKYSSRYDAYREGKNPTTFRRELFNGSIMDLGVYSLSVAVALFGKPLEVFATASLLESGVDCMGTIVLKYNGFDCTVLHSKVTNTNIVSEIQGEDGNLIFPHPSLLDKIYFQPRLHKEDYDLDEQGRVLVSLPCPQHFVSELTDFVYNVTMKNQQSLMNDYQQILDLYDTLTEARIQSGVRYDCDEE